MSRSLAVFLAAFALATSAHAQAPVTFTAEQDHQNMLDQLGIRALRPGPSGDESAPNHANYDESLANPYPVYPDALTLNSGQKVTTPEQWWKQRRPQIVEAFEREVYGRLPAHIPQVTWRTLVTDREQIGFTPVIAKRLIGHVDNSAYPAIAVDLKMTVVVPANAGHPVPLLILFRHADLPAPAQPTEEELERINVAAKALLARQDPSLRQIFDAHPAYTPIPSQEKSPFVWFTPTTPGGEPPTEATILAAGWGYAELDPASIQADNAQGLTRGIIGLVNHGQPRHPDDWGALRAWAWGAARALDFLETDPAVDARHVGIEGVSRYGKAALVTLAFEQRFSMGLIGSSGEGGAKPHRRNFGEALETLTGGEYYWMAGNLLKYGASDAKSGPKTANDLPVDANELIALCAPRLAFISYGVPEKGDSKWLDQRGSFMATVAAQPVYRLLGAPALGLPDDYQNAQLPPVDHSLLDGKLVWRQANQGHTDASNIKPFLLWADKWIHSDATYPPPKAEK